VAAPTPAALNVRPSSPLLWLGRVLLLLLAGGAAGYALRARHAAPARGAGSFVCPMHPGATSTVPADCPICGMALIPATRARGSERAGGSPAANEGEVAADISDVGAARKRVSSHEILAPAEVQAEGVIAALLPRDDLVGLMAGEVGHFQPSAHPAESVEVRLSADPPTPHDDATSRVAFLQAAGGPPLPPGQAGWLTLPARPREMVVIPHAAIVSSAEGHRVFVSSANGGPVRARAVTIGKVSYGLASVVSGLSDGEWIAVRNAFFLDAEERLLHRGKAPPSESP
jgi:hypothetical protein